MFSPQRNAWSRPRGARPPLTPERTPMTTRFNPRARVGRDRTLAISNNTAQICKPFRGRFSLMPTFPVHVCHGIVLSIIFSVLHLSTTPCCFWRISGSRIRRPGGLQGHMRGCIPHALLGHASGRPACRNAGCLFLHPFLVRERASWH